MDQWHVVIDGDGGGAGLQGGAGSNNIHCRRGETKETCQALGANVRVSLCGVTREPIRSKKPERLSEFRKFKNGFEKVVDMFSSKKTERS